MKLLKRSLTALKNLIAFRVLFATISSSFSFYILGLSLSYPSPVRGELVEQRKFLNQNTFPIFSASLYLGSALATMLGAYLNHVLGRKCTIIISSVFSFVGWIVLAVGEVEYLLILGRVLTGFHGGICGAIVPIYIAELAHHKSKGLYLSILVVILRLGIISSNLFGMWLNFRWLALLGALISVIFAILMLFQPYSPTWLLSRTLDKQAKNILQTLRSPDSNVTLEVQTIKSILKSTEGKFIDRVKMLFESYHMKALLIGISFTLCVQLSGVNILFTYSSTLFEKNVLLSPNLASTTLTLSFLIGSIIAGLLIDRLGRKFLLLVSCICATFFLTIFGIFLSLTTATSSSSDSCATIHFYSQIESIWLIFILCIIGFLTATGWLAVLWVFIAELFPIRIKGIAAYIVTTILWFLAALFVFIFPFLYRWIGPDKTFYSFALINGLLCFYILLFIPETKQKPIDEIERIFQEHTIFCSLKPILKFLKRITPTAYVYEISNI